MPKLRRITIDPAYAGNQVVEGLVPFLQRAARDPFKYGSQVEEYMKKHGDEALQALSVIFSYDPNKNLFSNIGHETLKGWARVAAGTTHSKIEEGRQEALKSLKLDLIRPYKEPEVFIVKGDISALFVDRSEAENMSGSDIIDSRRASVVYTDSNIPEESKRLIRSLKGATVEDFVNELEWGQLGKSHLESQVNRN